MIFILSVIAGSSVEALNTCPDAFRGPFGPHVDLRFGRASQKDPAFADLGLLDESGSLLCGPTCIFNGLHKFRTVLGLTKGRYEPSSKQIADLVKRIFPHTGADVVHKGAQVEDVAQAFRETLREEGLAAKVVAHTSRRSHRDVVTGLDFKALNQAADDNKIVIVGFGYYRTDDFNRANDYSRKAGHFMLLAGHNPETEEFYFIDPLAPRQLRVARMKRVEPDDFFATSLLVTFEDGHVPSGLILVDGMVVVTRTQTDD